MPQTPCKDCADRAVGCHSGCDKYRAFLVDNERIKKLQKQERNVDASLHERSAKSKDIYFKRRQR